LNIDDEQKMAKELQKETEIVFFCDIHGHSHAKGSFTFGFRGPSHPPEKVIPN
jgi:hypothetical protein